MAAVTAPNTGQLAAIGGVALPLSPTPIVISRGVVVKAFASNTASIFIGNSSSVTTSTGFVLAAGDQMAFDIQFFAGKSPMSNISNADLQTIYAISDSTGQKLAFWWV